MGFPLLLIGGSLLGGGLIWKVSDDVAKTAKVTAEPIKKAVKVSALGAGAFYARKVASSTNSPVIKKIANLTTLASVALIGKEVIQGKKSSTTNLQLTPSERMEAEGSFWE
jgi:hypothetical protein